MTASNAFSHRAGASYDDVTMDRLIGDICAGAAPDHTLRVLSSMPDGRSGRATMTELASRLGIRLRDVHQATSWLAAWGRANDHLGAAPFDVRGGATTGNPATDFWFSTAARNRTQQLNALVRWLG